MIEINYATIRKPGFVNGWNKIANHTGFTPKRAYSIGRIKAKLDQEGKVSQEVFNKLVHKYADFKECGKLLIEPTGPGSFQIPEEKKDDYEKELKEFEALSFEVKWPKIHIDDMEDLKLSPSEIEGLDAILDFEEAEAPVPVDDNVTAIKTAGK